MCVVINNNTCNKTNHENNNGLIVSSNKNDYIHLTNHKIRGKEAITQDESLPITSLSTRQNDKTCFGVMSCIPFNEYSHWKIADQFKNRAVQKEYLALTWGEWDEHEGLIENKLSRSKKNPLKYQSSIEGRIATSKFKLINYFPRLEKQSLEKSFLLFSLT